MVPIALRTKLECQNPECARRKKHLSESLQEILEKQSMAMPQ